MSESTSLFLTYSYSDLILTFLLWNYVLGCFWTFVHLCAFLLLKKAGEKEVASCGLHFSYWMVTAGDWKWYCPEGGYHSWIPMSLKGLSFDSALWSVMAVGHDLVSGLIVLWMYFYVQGCFFFFLKCVREEFGVSSSLQSNSFVPSNAYNKITFLDLFIFCIVLTCM